MPETARGAAVDWAGSAASKARTNARRAVSDTIPEFYRPWPGEKTDFLMVSRSDLTGSVWAG